MLTRDPCYQTATLARMKAAKLSAGTRVVSDLRLHEKGRIYVIAEVQPDDRCMSGYKVRLEGRTEWVDTGWLHPVKEDG